MIYIVIYAIIGLIVGLITWFYFSRVYSERVIEGDICVYLFMCVFLWPISLYAMISDLIKFIIKFCFK
jgi:hypothetical protein